MSQQEQEDVTQILQRIADGQREAVDRLLPHVYGDLRLLAGRLFLGQRRDHTLQPTALVSEAYLRLVGGDHAMENRHHFLCVAAKAMRQLLADHARRHLSEKRGGNRRRIMLVDVAEEGEGPLDFEALSLALTELERVDPRQASIVEMRFLAGMTYEEIGASLGIAARTARLDWKMAQSWLGNEMRRLSRAGEDEM